MSNHHQRIRDELAKGDKVAVVVKTRATQNPKRRSATVLDIGRAAAKVRFEDGHECPIRFCDLEIETKSRPKQAPAAKLPAPVTPIIRPAVEAKPRHPAPKETVDPPTPNARRVWDSDIQSSIAALVEMGGDLVEPMQERISQLALALDALRDERREIDSEIDATVEEKTRLLKQLEQLAPLARVLDGLRPKP